MDFKKPKIIIAGLALAVALVWAIVFQKPDNNLHLVFCDVGQGDATLISYQSVQVLIDGGPDGRVINCLSENMPIWDRTIETVVLTHPQADHFGGLIEVIDKYDVGQFIVNQIAPSADTAGFWELRKRIINEGNEIHSPQAGEEIQIGEVKLSILWPKQKLGDSDLWQDKNADRQAVLGTASVGGDLNDTSVILELSYGDFQALLTGDISSLVDNKLSLEDVEVLKVAHHGSKYSTSSQFLDKISPELAVISVGKNSFGHPTSEVLDRLAEKGIRISRTDENGEIKITTDGKTWTSHLQKE